jgi:hypothetical protein
MTTSLRVQAVASVDGKQASVELQRLTVEVADLKIKTLEEKAAAKALSAELKTLNITTAEGAARAAEIRNAMRENQIAMIQTGAAATAASRQMQQLSQSTGQAAASAGQMRSASANLGQQIGDITQGLALGISPMTIFAQQGGQVAFAMSGMGGAIGKVATFLSGPWGAAITGATIVLGSLWQAHQTAAEKADQQAGADKTLKQALEELDRATGLSNKSTAESIRLGELDAAVAAKRAAAKRDLAQAALDTARANLAAARADQQAGGASGANFGAGFVTSNAESALQRRQTELDAAQKELDAGTRRAAASATFGRASAAAKAATDAAAKANQAYEATVTAVQKAVESGSITEAQATARLVAAENTRKAATDSVKNAAKAARAAQAEHNKEVRDAARDAEKAAEAQRKLAAATASYTIAVPDVSGLKEGLDSQRQAERLKLSPGLAARVAEIDAERGKTAGDAFAEQALTQAVAIGQAIGGSAGAAIRTVAGLAQGAATGNFTGVGNAAGGALTLLAGQKRADGSTNAFSTGLREAIGAPLDGLKSAFKNVFSSESGQAFARLAGRAAGGAATGSAVAGLGNAIGAKLDKNGATIGGAVGGALSKVVSTLGPIGAALGPFAGVIGGVLGGLVGGLFGPKGSTTISASGGKVSSTGTGSAAVQKATGAIGNTITDALQSIADQLGGSIGDFSVSIGQRRGQFRVDRSGQGRLNGGTVTGTDSESEALSLALADALRDGAVRTSPRVQAALLRYADNVNKAVAEALKVKGLEDMLADRNNPFLAGFRSLETQLKQRLDVARENGFDLVEIEKINGEDRAKALKETLASATGSIRNLLTDLTIGSGATGSPTQRLAGLTAERDRLTGLARAGDGSQLDAIASIVKQIDDLQRETFGSTAGFATGRADSVALLNDLIRQTEDRAKAAADQARTQTQTTVDKLTELNASADDQFNVQTEMKALLASIDGRLAAGTGGGGFALSSQYARV